MLVLFIWLQGRCPPLQKRTLSRGRLPSLTCAFAPIGCLGPTRRRSRRRCARDVAKLASVPLNSKSPRSHQSLHYGQLNLEKMEPILLKFHHACKITVVFNKAFYLNRYNALKIVTSCCFSLASSRANKPSFFCNACCTTPSPFGS